MSKKQKKHEIDRWQAEKPLLEKARQLHGYYEVPADDKDYYKILADAKEKLNDLPAPAMPLIEKAMTAERQSSNGKPLHNESMRKHMDHFSQSAYDNIKEYGLIHTPVSIKKANKIPAAKAAVDSEWDAHAAKKTWNIERVKPRAEVIKEAKAKNMSVHFGTLMDLCHLKHAELDVQHQKYKGRVVFRGDQVKDETGFYAVFTEQGASASQMVAAKFLDSLARMPGMKGQAADAVKAYTQVSLLNTHELLGLPENQCPETWISLPPARRPASWKDIDDPVCPLERNLYGHPIAGLLWEKHLGRALFQLAWTRVPSWECLYVHKDQGLFLSVYVDDFKMDAAAA